MTKLFLSPSTQEWNPYKTGGNEEYEMRLVVNAAKPYLDAAGFSVKIGGTVSARSSVNESNTWNADYHIAVHSNAGGGDGTVTFYHSGNSRGKALATAIQNAIAPISPGVDDGVKANDGLIEINGPSCTAVLTEVEFHDSVRGSEWIKNNEDLIGRELARGILKYFGKALPELKPAPAGWLRFWRLRSGAGDYFYTSSSIEVSAATKIGYTVEGPAFDISTTDATNTNVLYRLYLNGFHFYTASLQEAQSAQAGGWRLEGPVAMVGSRGAPVYRLRKGMAHLYTISDAEANTATGAGWVREGVAFYCGVS